MKRTRTLLVGVVALCLLCGVAYGQSPYELSFDFCAGWQGGQRETLTSSSDDAVPGSLYRYSKLEIPNRGLWIGAGLDARIGEDLKLFLQGWYFFPSNTEGSILLDPGGGGGPRYIPAALESHLDWWYVDGFGTYRLGGPLSGVLGVRFDHHLYFTEDPEILDLLIPLPPNEMRLDLNVLSTMPYFGLQWGPSNGLTLRMIYSPCGWMHTESSLSQVNNPIVRPPNWLGGDKVLSRKDFFELFGEYSGEVVSSVDLAVFGRGTWLSGTTDAPIRETIVNGTAEYDVSYRRVGWTIGARATLLFDVPEYFLPW